MLWLHEGSESGPGVLYLPARTVTNPRLVHWIFVVDRSHSMNRCCPGTRETCWSMVRLLMDEVLSFLKARGRGTDLVTVICFHSLCETVIDARPLRELDSILARVPLTTERGLTDLSRPIQAAVDAMRATDPSYDLAELFFTDGAPTAGERSLARLAELKRSAYVDLARDPFLWVAGIGVPRKIVEQLAGATDRSFWSEIAVDRLECFAVEVGTAIGTVLGSERLEVDGQRHWVVDGVPILLPLDRRPAAVQETCLYPEAVALVRGSPEESRGPVTTNSHHHPELESALQCFRYAFRPSTPFRELASQSPSVQEAARALFHCFIQRTLDDDRDIPGPPPLVRQVNHE